MYIYIYIKKHQRHDYYCETWIPSEMAKLEYDDGCGGNIDAQRAFLNRCKKKVFTVAKHCTWTAIDLLLNFQALKQKWGKTSEALCALIQGNITVSLDLISRYYPITLNLWARAGWGHSRTEAHAHSFCVMAISKWIKAVISFYLQICFSFKCSAQ